MKQIPLTQGKFAIVDDKDYDWLNQWKWHAAKHPPGGYYYARRQTSRKNKKRWLISMHRQIMNVLSGMQIDHINHNSLDNRRCNLRICNQSQNNQNRSKAKNEKSSQYKGVSQRSGKKKWRAHIQLNKEPLGIGSFDNEIEAARAYDNKAKELFGEFALLNFS